MPRPDDQVMFVEGNLSLSRLETFLHRVIEDCKTGRATVEEGAGTIKLLVEAVKDGQWSDVQMWLQTAQDADDLLH